MSKAKAERPDRPPARECIIALRGHPAYRDWANGLAKQCGVSLSEAVTLGLAELAKSRGYAAEMPGR